MIFLVKKGTFPQSFLFKSQEKNFPFPKSPFQINSQQTKH